MKGSEIGVLVFYLVVLFLMVGIALNSSSYFTSISLPVVCIAIITSVALMLTEDVNKDDVSTIDALSYSALIFSVMMLLWFTYLNLEYLRKPKYTKKVIVSPISQVTEGVTKVFETVSVAAFGKKKKRLKRR